MTLKKQATEALRGLSLLAESLATEAKRKALDQIDVVTRFIGELRREKSALKQRAEKAEAESEPLREQIRDLKSQLLDAQRELDSTKQRLVSTEQRLATTQQRLDEATTVKECDTPQGRLAYLVPGPEQPSANTPEERKVERQKRREQLHDLLPKMLPKFGRSVLAGADKIIIHQDGFAASYHADEYTMLGMAVKFAGDRGREIIFSGWSGETCGEEYADEVAQLREQAVSD